MSMLKKTAALTVSAVLLLQPMTASAVTWSNIVDGLRNSGSNRYTEDGTTIEKDGDNYTVSGGTIEDDGWIDEWDFGKNGNVTLNDLVIDGHLHIFSEDGSVISMVIGEGTLIKGNINAHANGAGNSLTITNNGKVNYAGINSKDGGYVYIVNNGNINRITGRAEGNGSVTEIENAQNGTTRDIWIVGKGKGSTISAENNGHIDIGVEMGNYETFEPENDGYQIDFINHGTIGNEYFSFFLGNGKVNIEDDKLEHTYLGISVKKGTTVEEILQQLEDMPDADEIYVGEYEQDEYGNWEWVNDYYLKKMEEPENPDELENPNEPENPEQPEATQQPTFEVSKYDQERHEMEEKRKEEAIGGVYGSPYWVKQLYLGYHSLNLRLFVGEQQSNFKQSLSWMPDSTKQLTLRVNTDAPEKLTMRLDEKALETLERTEFSVITLLDKSGNAVMQYSLSDLRSVYDQYGLSGDDQMVVGGANDDVMKIVNGEMKPIEA